MKEESQHIDLQIEELEKLIFDNPDLENLESIIDQFNIFSSLGIISQEIRHSHFLAWLLNPSETHNLADYFLNMFLKTAIKNSQVDRLPLNIFDIDSFDLSEARVMREWESIDVLIVDDVNEFVCVIENKIDSQEHSNQLAKYKKRIEQQFSTYKKIYIYLTVHGSEAETEADYIAISHREVALLIETLLERKESQLNDDVTLFIRHYLEMLKRYIMEESDVQQLCEKIYKRHKKALDLIYKYKPDIYSVVQEILEELIDENPELIKDHCTRTGIRFIPKELDFIPRVGNSWTKTKRVLLFEIQNYAGRVMLFLIIGPSDENPEVRELIYEQIKDDPTFKRSFKKMTAKWSTIHRFELAKIPTLESKKERAEQKEILAKKFNHFIEHDLPAMQTSLGQLKGKFDDIELED
jgi:hypothetical protein